ncbi:hypothetical protein D1872_230670 [compost metagenome]
MKHFLVVIIDMIISWVSQTIPVEVIATLIELTVIHVSGSPSRMTNFLTIINNRLTFGCDLQGCCNFLFTLKIPQNLSVQSTFFEFLLILGTH